MKRRDLPLALSLCIFAMCFCATCAHALTVGGAVRQPLNLTAEDLSNLSSSDITLTEVSRKEGFSGTFHYRGVSLKVLLQMAAVQKEVEGYSKAVDLAILLRSKEGKTAVLSWGEVFYKNPGEAIIATSAKPVMPGAMHSCAQCHGPEVYQPALDKLGRKIDFPKLVIAGDFYSDRFLEDLTSIEVVDLRKPEEKKTEGQQPSSSSFTITGGNGQGRVFTTLEGYRRASVIMKELGSGRGYHGTKRFEGVPLRELLASEGEGTMDKIVLVTSTDGYRSLLSLGELFLSSYGERVVITDHAQGTAPKSAGKFTLVVPDDIFADRMVKTIHKVEVLPVTPPAKVYIIGVGCGDTSLITLEAISHMGKVSAFVGGKSFADRFAKYMDGKPVLFDPFSSWEPVYKKKHPELSDEEVKKRTTALRAAEIKSIWDMLNAGKSVAVLEPGDPTIYGGWENWLLPEFGGHVEVVAGMSSFSAANAMMAKNIASNNNSMVLTTPWALQANKGLIKNIAAAGDTMAIFMGLKELKELLPVLTRYYPAGTPVTIAFKAGITHEKRLVKTPLSALLSTAEKERESFLGLIYIGGK